MRGQQLFYAFGMGERSLVSYMMSVNTTKYWAEVNKSRPCGKLNAHVPTKTAIDGIPFTHPESKIGQES